MLDAQTTDTPEAINAAGFGTPRNISLNNKRTTVRLDETRWQSLHNIASLENCHIHDICLAVYVTIENGKPFSDSLRHFIDEYYKSKTAVAMKLKAIRRRPLTRRGLKKVAEAVTLESSLRKAIGA